MFPPDTLIYRPGEIQHSLNTPWLLRRPNLAVLGEHEWRRWQLGRAEKRGARSKPCHQFVCVCVCVCGLPSASLEKQVCFTVFQHLLLLSHY